MTYEIGTLVNVRYQRRTKRGTTTSVRVMEIASAYLEDGVSKGYKVRKPGTTGKGGPTIFPLADIAPVEAAPAEPVRELPVHYAPSKRTRTEGARHPFEAINRPTGSADIVNEILGH